jgi:NAD(P)-dependent dehydrogenase (short-subunit alcohol dehydrogenase family)
MGVEGDDKGGSNRSRTAQNPSELGAPWSDRHRDVKGPYSRTENQQRLQLVPMKRMGTAEEVASLVLFLLSDESGYITGAEVAIDGGATL